MKSKQNKTLLLVEDEFLIALSKQQELEGYNYNVIHANTAEKAIKLAIENSDIDLILMDIDLGPGIDGTMAAELILKEKEVPVMFMSSHTEPEIVRKTEKITSYGYVVKNSTITVLDASIKMAFKLFEAQKKLHINEMKHNAMMLNITDVISIIDKNGKIRYKSGNATKLFGWDFGDLEGSDYQNVVHPDDLERVNILFSKVLESDKSTITIEFKYKCKDNSYKPVELTATNLLKDSKINGILVSFHDISKRIQDDKDLFSYQQKLALHIEQTPLAVIDWDSEFRVASWNRSAERIFGFTLNEALGKHAAGLIVPECAKKQVNEVWDKLMLNKGGTRSSNGNITKEGKSILCEWYNTAVVNNEGNVIGVSSLVKDITEQKLTENALDNEKNNLKNIFEAMTDGVYIIDPNYDIKYANPVVSEEMGIYEGTKCYSYFYELSEICPWCKHQKILKGETIHWERYNPKTKKTYDLIETPILNIDGTYSKLTIYNNITERKLVEEKLKKSEENYRRVVEETDVLISQVDKNGSIVFINNVAKKIFGVEKEQCVGLSAFDFIHPDDREKTNNWFQECTDHNIQQGTIENRQVNKETSAIIDMVWNSRFYYTDEGNLKIIDSIGHNITDQNKSEKKIKKLLLEKEILLKEVHHRIKNNMTMISSLLSMHSNKIKIPEASQILQDAISRIESMGVLYDKLYRSESYNELSSRDYFSKLIIEISQLFSNTTKIKIENQIDDFNMDAKIIFPLGIILNELLTNTMKYAFIGKRKGKIIISLKERSGNITLILQDNGNGLPENFDIIEHNGFGLMLIKLLSEQLGGDFTIKTDRGTKSTLKFTI